MITPPPPLSLAAGGELMKHIYKKGKLDETETRKYMRQIVSAVDHLHKAGIIHRCVCVCVGGGGVTEKRNMFLANYYP